jgi:hypothetical protein
VRLADAVVLAVDRAAERLVVADLAAVVLVADAVAVLAADPAAVAAVAVEEANRRCWYYNRSGQ